MKRLSKKETNEVVTKGFLKATLEEGDYASKDFLMAQNYATKTDLYEVRDDLLRHTAALAEHFQHLMQASFEGFNAKWDNVILEMKEENARMKADSLEWKRIMRSLAIQIPNHERRLRKLEGGVA